MKVAVTGATGFIGRHVLDQLLARGVEVTAVTRKPHDFSSAQISTACLDIAQAEPDSFDRIGQPDALIHLAWDGLPNYRSLHHFETQLPEQYRFLRHLVDGGLKSLVATGTCFEYGMQSGCLREDAPTLPDNPYGFAKDTLRKQLQMLQSQHSFSLAWCRLFYLHGPGQSPKSLLSQLAQAVNDNDNEPMFNMSQGEQLRDYLPVQRVAEHLVDLALADTNCGPINICSGQPISVRKLVEDQIAEHDWQIGLNLGHYPYPDYEPMAFWGDNQKLQKLTAPQAGESL